MTLRVRKKVATTLLKIVKVEFRNASWSRVSQRHGLRRLAKQAQDMGLLPEDLLTSNGRAAFQTIARAIASDPTSSPTLGAEWALVVAFVEPEFSIEEKELLIA